MRKFLYLCLVLIVVGMYSCDKVNNPFISKSTNATIPTTPPTRVDSTTSADDALFKILVEDYTAHHCPNCPLASIQCEAAISHYPNNIIFVEDNVCVLAQAYAAKSWGLSPPLDSSYMVDYRNRADSDWNTTFINGDVGGLPGTMVNRLRYDGIPGGAADLYGNFIDLNSLVDSILTPIPPQLAKIHIVDSLYAPPASTISMTITTNLTSVTAGTKYYLVVGLAEDSIFDWQDSLSNDRQYYLKRMTFRGTINNGGHGNGDSLKAIPLTTQTFHYVYQNTTAFKYNSKVSVPDPVPLTSWNMAHMYVVAFIYQISTSAHNQMVLQAQKLHL